MSTSSDLARLRDQFSDRTNALRKNLLLSSVVLTGITITGAVPQSVEALGIQFASDQRQAFLWGIASIVVYFAVSFAFAAVADVAALKAVEVRAGQEENKVLTHQVGAVRWRRNWELAFPFILAIFSIIYTILKYQIAAN